MVKKCEACEGTGLIDGVECSECKGKGKVEFKQGILTLRGKYRVKARFDLNLNDFPRNVDSQGKRTNIDSSFNDFYIPCKFKSEIVDAGRKELMAYIPSVKRGKRIMREIKNTYGKNIIHTPEILPDATIKEENRWKYTNQELKGDGSHGEVTFYFKLKDIDKIAEFIEASTWGAKINPFSKDNLIKNQYDIPEEDLELYEEIKERIPKRTLPTKNGGTNIIPSGNIVRKLLSGFNVIITQKKGEDFNVSGEQKLRGIYNEEFIHSIGLWNEFIDYLEKEIKNYE